MAQQQWHIRTGNKVVGPVGTIRLRQLVAEGRVTPETLVSRDGEQWVAASRVKGLLPPASSDDPFPVPPGDTPPPLPAGDQSDSGPGRPAMTTWTRRAALVGLPVAGIVGGMVLAVALGGFWSPRPEANAEPVVPSTRQPAESPSPKSVTTKAAGGELVVPELDRLDPPAGWKLVRSRQGGFTALAPRALAVSPYTQPVETPGRPSVRYGFVWRYDSPKRTLAVNWVDLPGSLVDSSTPQECLDRVVREDRQGLATILSDGSRAFHGFPSAELYGRSEKGVLRMRYCLVGRRLFTAGVVCDETHVAEDVTSRRFIESFEWLSVADAGGPYEDLPDHAGAPDPPEAALALFAYEDGREAWGERRYEKAAFDIGDAIRQGEQAGVRVDFLGKWYTSYGYVLTKDGEDFGDAADALAAGDRAVALGYKSPSTHILRGHVLSKMGRIQESNAAFREAERLESLGVE